MNGNETEGDRASSISPDGTCDARHPDNTSIVPCMLPAGHDSRAPHWSTSGCAGGACQWVGDPDAREPGWVPVKRAEVVDLAAALRASVEAARERRAAREAQEAGPTR